MKRIIYMILMLFVTLALQAQYSNYDAYTVKEKSDSATSDFSLQVKRYAYDTIKSKNKIQHNLFLELGGNSLWLYNITYDCSFLLAGKHKIAIASGFQYIPGEIWPIFGHPQTFTASVQVNYLYGKNHHLETGIGINVHPLVYYDEIKNKWVTNDSELVIPLRIGYRYQQDNGGLFFRLAFVAGFIKGGDFFGAPFIPSFGLSIGYTFKNRQSDKE